MSDPGQIKAKREAAARARRLALQLTSEDDRTRALGFADELDAEADALERTTAPVASGPRVTQIQMQVQQGPPAQDDGGKDESDKTDDSKKDDGGKEES
jgi:hypothetical protein